MTKQKKRLGNVSFMFLTIAFIGMLTGAQSIFIPEKDGQSQLVVLPEVEFATAFALDSLCDVTGENSLDLFFAELELLKEGKDTVISVVQLGDSHIQCGHLSGQLMRLFHRDFGNPGRGLIVPLKLTGTNEPDDYFIRSTGIEWEKSRCIQANPFFPVGLGGVAIRSQAKKINMEVLITEKNGAGYSFNKAILYRHPEALPLIATATKSKTVTARGAISDGLACDTFTLSTNTDTLMLRSHTLPVHLNTVYYGLSLTNGQPGVLFHSIGVNGAMFINYTNANYIKQLAVLRPSLLIISLGTNETFGRRFSGAEFHGQVTAFISLLQTYLPQTALLLTTPPECFKAVHVNKKRVYKRNENTELASQILRSVADKEGIACFDLFSITGGKGSSQKWKSANLMGRDQVHFTKEGYRDQGALLFRALMKDYNRYVSTKQDTIPSVQPDSTLTYAVR